MIIVVSGGKQHGKDTFAKELIEAHPELQFERRAFADKMKEFACELLGCTLDELENLKVKEDTSITCFGIAKGTTMRSFLQVLGQYMKELTMDDLFWCHQLERTMLDRDKNYIITDCRFDFEAEFIRGLAKSLDVPCKVFKIFNPRVELGEDTHVSEQSFDTIKFDDVILNTGTIQDLRNTAIEIIGDIDARV